jgi:phosphate-selective porin OprO/OprP
MHFPTLVLITGLHLLAAVGGAGAASPEEPAANEPDPQPVGRATRIFDRIWGHATLYENADNPVLKQFAFRGRFQADFPLFGSNQGSYDEPQVRRLRLGFKSHWLADLVVHVEVDIDATCEAGERCDDDAYEGLTDAYIGWAPLEAFELKLGKLSAPFTLDGTTSSTRLLTLERDNLSNNLWFPVEYHTGLNASGRIDSWRYLVGVYSSSTTENFGNLDGGYFLLLTLANDLSERLGVRESLLTLNYVYNRSDEDNVSTRDLAHVVSLHFRFDTGTWGVRSDLTGGIGYGTQSDLIGLTLMPFCQFSKHFQLVTRYTYVKSFGEAGVRFGRYESQIDSRMGESYNEFFVGLNWLIYGHRFKLQTGVKYTQMDDLANDGGDYRGWGWTTGLRMSW